MTSSRLQRRVSQSRGIRARMPVFNRPRPSREARPSLFGVPAPRTGNDFRDQGVFDTVAHFANDQLQQCWFNARHRQYVNILNELAKYRKGVSKLKPQEARYYTGLAQQWNRAEAAHFAYHPSNHSAWEEAQEVARHVLANAERYPEQAQDRLRELRHLHEEDNVLRTHIQPEDLDEELPSTIRNANYGEDGRRRAERQAISLHTQQFPSDNEDDNDDATSGSELNMDDPTDAYMYGFLLAMLCTCNLASLITLLT